MKKKFPNAIGTHSTIHRQALIVKTMSDELGNVLNDEMKVVNFIKANALNSSQFVDLCKESDSEFETLLLHLHVRWLSNRKKLQRVFVLRKELYEFLHYVTTKQIMYEQFLDDRFLTC